MTQRVSALALALAGVVAGLVIALWPLHANGVTGNALVPRYHDFGWYAYQPMPEHVTVAELRRAGVRVPQDVVEQRRRLAASLAAAGLILGLAVRLRSAWTGDGGATRRRR